MEIKIPLDKVLGFYFTFEPERASWTFEGVMNREFLKYPGGQPAGWKRMLVGRKGPVGRRAPERHRPS